MTFVDTNVIIDILQDDAIWGTWSSEQLHAATEAGPVTINAVVIAELSRNYPSLAALQDRTTALSLDCIAIDEEAGFLAGRRFADYRQRRPAGAPVRPLPDFLIGAHALSRGAPLLTRDTALYRRYFPDLTLITPEDEQHG